MGSICRAYYTWITRIVKLMQHAIANRDVEPIGHPCEVTDLTCRAEILTIVLYELNTLQHSDLSSRSVAMVNSYIGVSGRGWLKEHMRQLRVF